MIRTLIHLGTLHKGDAIVAQFQAPRNGALRFMFHVSFGRPYNVFTMTHPLLRRLAERPLLCDGAMGTQLYARGIAFDQCFDELTLSQPELISAIHRSYLDAGADLVETNTFGANAIKLREH